MASIVTRKGKRGDLREIQFALDGRKAVRIGRCSLKQAATVRLHVEGLLAQAMTGHPADNKTQAWLRDLPDKMHRRVASTGLCEPRDSYNLLVWVDKCIKGKEGADEASTTRRRKQARRYLAEFFTEPRDLRTFTPGDAEDFEAFLRRQDLADATIRKRLADARQWFGQAIKHELIEKNPFEGVKVTVGSSDNMAFIDTPKAMAVMEELPNTRLRAIFALARWGGLRTPSEHRFLTWEDIDWHKNRIHVTDVKRKKKRLVPLYPELERPLQDWMDESPEGIAEVFPGMSPNASALTSAMQRAIKNAGFTVWPRLMQNLRSSRQTELESKYPTHVVCAWMGNSSAVASKHYLQVRESDFESAVKIAAEPARKGVHRQAKTPSNAPKTH